MVFLIDLPLIDVKQNPPLASRFLTHLRYYLQAMGVESGMIDSLSKYDFSGTEDVGFVYSMFVLKRIAMRRWNS